MAPNRNNPRANGRVGGPKVRDARDVLRRKNAPNAARRTPGVAKRVVRTSQGLVTNKRKAGISTSQLRNRQSEQAPGSFKQRAQRVQQPTRVGVKAAFKRSAIVNSNPVLQRVLCFLMPVGTVGSNEPPSTEGDVEVPISVSPVIEKATDAVNNVIDVKGGNDGPDPKELSAAETTSDPTLNDESNDSLIAQHKDDDSDIDDFELPSTCVTLVAPNGSNVFLVGTAHFSTESHRDVRRVIRKVNPQRIVVELCKERLVILTMDEDKLLEEASSVDLKTMRHVVQRMGALQGAMYLLLKQWSAKLTTKMKLVSGGEFRAAYSECLKRPDCHMFLGDRQLSITLKRAWASIGLWERITLLWVLFTNTEDIDIEDVERCKDKDVLQQLLGDILNDFPNFSKILITERDLYLTRSVYDVATRTDDPVNVVAVVGIGHQQGMMDNWKKADEISLADLMTIPERTLGVRIASGVFRITFWASVGYVAYKVTPKVVKVTVANGVKWGVDNGLARVKDIISKRL